MSATQMPHAAAVVDAERLNGASGSGASQTPNTATRLSGGATEACS